MGFKDPNKQRQYQRDRLRKRRELWVSRLGGECVKCGVTSDLEFDHIDPEQKQFNISGIWSRKDSVIAEEMEKCQLLCSSCHRAKTKEENGWGQHGRVNRYREGCRCEECREAVKLKARRYRASLRGV